jgi:hypothetical protein
MNGSNNNLEPWIGIAPADSCVAPLPQRHAEFQRREAASLAWLDEVFAAAAGSTGVFLLIQAKPRQHARQSGLSRWFPDVPRAPRDSSAAVW